MIVEAAFIVTYLDFIKIEIVLKKYQSYFLFHINLNYRLMRDQEAMSVLAVLGRKSASCRHLDVDLWRF